MSDCRARVAPGTHVIDALAIGARLIEAEACRRRGPRFRLSVAGRAR